MLKGHESLKSTVARAAVALRALLAEVSLIEVEAIDEAPPGRGAQGGGDLRVKVRTAGRPSYVLNCQWSPSGQPRQIRAALLEVRDSDHPTDPKTLPVVMAPYLSTDAQALCRDQGVGFLDLEGNARLVFDGVFIERRVATRPPVERRVLKGLFTAKAAQVLRVLLRDPVRAWRLADLAAAAQVSLGHASNVRKALLDREWARVVDDGLCLAEPQRLLDAWRDAYHPPAGRRESFYTSLHGRLLDEAILQVMSAAAGQARIALASFSAANWLAPYGRIALHSFYADEPGMERLRVGLALAPAAQGENLVVILPKEVGVFLDTLEPVPGLICTSPVQTYLDLSVAGERGREAAEHLRQERLSWRT